MALNLKTLRRKESSKEKTAAGKDSADNRALSARRWQHCSTIACYILVCKKKIMFVSKTYLSFGISAAVFTPDSLSTDVEKA